MSAPELSTDAILLDRVPGADTWMRLQCFAVEHGMLDCMQRLSKRAGTATPLDLFDEIHLHLETRNQGRTWFVREAVVAKRHERLGASYAVLQHACRFARVLVRNPLHEDSRPAVASLLARAIAAWETGTRPDVVYLKSLYLLARDEGYPVQEEWAHQLAADDTSALASILHQPVAQQTATESAVAHLGLDLENYLRNTGFHFDS